MFSIEELSSSNTFKNKNSFSSASIIELDEKYIQSVNNTLYKILAKKSSLDIYNPSNKISVEHKTDTATIAKNDEQEQLIKASFEKKLLFLLHNENIEAGEVSSVDYFIEDSFKKFSNTKYWLSDVASKCTKDPTVLSGLLLLISRLSSSQMGEVGYIIAMAALNHSNLEIRENAIRIYETYSDQRSLEMLEASRPDNIQWLENYKKLVMNDLKSILQA